MKRGIAKTFKTIFIVLAVILLILTVFLYYVDSPVVEEGQEPTVAQKIILLGKQYLGEILAICGVSAVGLIGVLTKLILNSANKTLQQSEGTSAEVADLKSELAESRKENSQLRRELTLRDKKQDIANNLIMTIFSLSDLPAAVRERVYRAQTEYNALGGTTESVAPTVEPVKNVDESKVQPAETSGEPTAEAPAATVTTGAAATPLYL